MKLEAVVESIILDEEEPLWPVARGQNWFYIHLNGSTPPEAIGSIVYNLIPIDDEGNVQQRTISESFAAIVQKHNEDILILSGGVRLDDERGNVITPGCCCGLEEWRNWFKLFDGENLTWWGHDPSPWVEVLPSGVRAYFDGGVGTPRVVLANATCIELSFDELRVALSQVQADLLAFLPRLEAWAQQLEPTLSTQLVDCFDKAFSIRKDYAAYGN